MDVPRLLAMRDHFLEVYDFAMVAEIDVALNRLGYRPPVFFETAVSPIEQAVPVKRGPGRPRKTPIKE